MTGYASAQQAAAQQPAGPEGKAAAAGRLGLEIRSVNSRFLDLSFRLSDDLRQHEPALRELLQAKLKRGKVEVRAGVETPAGESLREPTVKLLQKLGALQDSVRSWLPDARALSVADVIRLGASEEGPDAQWGEAIQALAATALKDLMAAREREGARLTAMLQGHLGQLRELASQAQPLVPQLVEQQRNRFLERWKEAMALANPGGADRAAQGSVLPEAAQDRALTEATAFAIRIDVAEEVTRLLSHVEEIERLLKKGGEVGKRLDFLIQELHREANTLGSKSAALELTRISVDMKVLVEQMREQVQNIE